MYAFLWYNLYMEVLKNKLQFIRDRISLFWDIDQDKIRLLSDEAIIERIFMYGDLSDYRELFNLFGREYCVEIFQKITKKDRINLRASTINYLRLIFNV